MIVQIITGTDGDWEGLYIDGRLVEEGHSLETIRVLRHLAPLSGPFTVLDTQEAVIEDRLPADIHDVNLVLP